MLNQVVSTQTRCTGLTRFLPHPGSTEILEEHNSGDEDESVTFSTATQPSKQFKEKRSDFDAIMDEFL